MTKNHLIQSYFTYHAQYKLQTKKISMNNAKTNKLKMTCKEFLTGTNEDRTNLWNQTQRRKTKQSIIR